MKNRLIDWAKSLDWDWVISRQRLFATPIPVWYCKSCGEIILAQEDWVPIDPKLEDPRIDKCPKCGGKEFTAETRRYGHMDGFLNNLRCPRWLARPRQIGNTCSQQACTPQAQTSSEPGHTTLWYATWPFSTNAHSTVS